MIEQLLRNYCESRHRWLIVTAGTFAVGLVLVIPLVDAYCAGRSEKETMLRDLISARQVAADLEKFERRVNEELDRLKQFEARTTDDESLAALRGKLVDLAKETGCSIRRIGVGAVSSRPWVPSDDLFASTSSNQGEQKSAFQLEFRPVSISISGSGANLRAMLDRIAASGMLMHAKMLEMFPSSANRQSLTLELELWYLNLARRG